MNNYSFYAPPSEEQEQKTTRSTERKKKDKGRQRQQRTQKENQLPAVIEEEISETTSNIIHEVDPNQGRSTKKKSGIKGFLRTCYRKMAPLQRKGYDKLSKDKGTKD